MTAMIVKITSKGKWEANVRVDGKLIGRASACDSGAGTGTWALSVHDEEEAPPRIAAMDGAYPARNPEELGWAIVECVDGVDEVHVNNKLLWRR